MYYVNFMNNKFCYLLVFKLLNGRYVTLILETWLHNSKNSKIDTKVSYLCHFWFSSGYNFTAISNIFVIRFIISCTLYSSMLITQDLSSS